jgi:3-methyl-2-oxobutanoate hydroxymethyltransferase
VHAVGSLGKIQRDTDQLLADAHAAADAGAFAIVLEMVAQSVAERITKELAIPTIGIGAGPHCDGQVLVTPDLLGLTPGFHPKFLKHYADLRTTAKTAIAAYSAEVRSGAFPTAEHAHD